MNFLKFRAVGKPITLLLLVFNFHFWGKQLNATANTSTFPSPTVLASTQTISPQDSTEDICPAALPTAIEAITNRSEFSHQRWGILIQTLSSDQTLYNREAQQYFIPASTTKLFTTAAALRQLGSQYRIRTSVYSNNNGVVRVVGRGDPSLTDVQLRDLAQQLKRQGISQVQQLILQDDYFQGSPIHPTWEWEDLVADYGAPVNSSIVNQNAIALILQPQKLGQPLQFRWNDPLAFWQWQVENNAVTGDTGTENSLQVNGVLGKPFLQINGQLAVDAEPEQIDLPVRDPAENFLRHFELALQGEGIRILSAIVGSASNQSESDRELAAVESPPLSQLIADTNQPSNNVYAESLLKTIGVNNKDDQKQLNTEEKGLQALKAILTNLGVDPKSYDLVDGSGLSRHNLISPSALVQLLKGMAQLPEAEIYRTSLPVAGVSGTLKNRFINTTAAGIVQAKTGTMTGVNTIAGYVDAPNYEKLVFSIMLNQSDLPAKNIRPAIDEIVVLLTRLRRC